MQLGPPSERVEASGIARPPDAQPIGASRVRRANPWLVWGAGLLVYVVAVAHRSSFGVAGLAAQQRFAVDATTLSLFVVVQLTVYSALQLPMGIALDRHGPRLLLTVGAVTMALGQLGMALAPTLPVALAVRVLVGAGDAAIFISAVRLAWSWFDLRHAPLLTQLTGIVGQLGQVLSAVGFATVLRVAGWTPAFVSMATLGAATALVAWYSVQNRALPQPPSSALTAASNNGLEMTEPTASIRATLRHPGLWLGFFTHWLGGVGPNTFVMMWGVSFMVRGQGLSPATAGLMLSLGVAVSIASGPLVGAYCARHPLRRSWLALAVAAAGAIGWVLVLAPSTPRPAWVIALFMGLISVGGPASLIGLEFAATYSTPGRRSTAQGLANMGGFVSAVTAMLLIGVVLDWLSPGAEPTLPDYRLAMLAIPALMAVAVVGILVTRPLARRRAGQLVPPLIEVIRRFRPVDAPDPRA